MDEDLLKKRILELRKRAEFSYRTEFTDFLTLSEIETAKTVLAGSNYMFYGGNPDAERRMLCIAEENMEITEEIFPIRMIHITPTNLKFAEQLTHRDVLGSVLGLGLERCVIGDIFLKDKDVFLFCKENMASFLTENLQKVRHTNVSCVVLDENPTEFEREFVRMERTVAANRLDTVAAAAFGLSRNRISSAISSGKVFINGREILSASVVVKEGDIISLRGEGKVRLKEIGGLTKKGRICVVLERYK